MVIPFILTTRHRGTNYTTTVVSPLSGRKPLAAARRIQIHGTEILSHQKSQLTSWEPKGTPPVPPPPENKALLRDY